MTFQVIVTEPAARAIEENVEWWARERSAKQAERWYQGIKTAINSLSKDPDRCMLASENEFFAYQIRELHFGLGRRPSHRIIFTVLKNHVLILAIRHFSQDEFKPEDLPEL